MDNHINFSGIIREMLSLINESKYAGQLKWEREWLEEKEKQLIEPANPKKRHEILEEMKRFLGGGMGSLGGLVLYPQENQNTNYVEYNRKFSGLVDRLYNLVENELTNVKIDK